MGIRKVKENWGKMLGHLGLNSSRPWLLAVTGLLAATTPMFSQAHQGGIKKQKNLPRDSIQVKVRRGLADDEDGIRRLFTMGNEAVPSLIKFLSDRDEEKRIGAARGLAYIGSQLGLQALRNALKAETDEETKSGMSCFLAGGLVATKSQSDLDFLRSTVERAHFAGDDDEKDFQGFCAALALGMRGGDDSVAILRKIPKDYLVDSAEIKKAIQWIESRSTPRPTPTEPSISAEEVIRRIVLEGTFFAEDEQNKTSIEELTFNRQRSKALVSLEIYNGPKDARGYDLILAKRNGVWQVVGIWFAWVA
jgi:hypothetical protein